MLVKTVDDYIDNSPEKFIPIITILQNIIMETLPNVIEKISYGIPFYYYREPLCYINVRNNCVDLGFSKGYKLSNKQGILESKNRKQVKSLSFTSVCDINKKLIKEILLEAALINEMNKKRAL